MPLLTAEAISSVAVELLGRSLVLPRTTTRVPSGDFPTTGGTVSLRVRVPRTARSQATPGATLTFDALDEQTLRAAARLHVAEALTAGTTALARATVEHRRPITFVIPILRKWTGVG